MAGRRAGVQGRVARAGSQERRLSLRHRIARQRPQFHGCRRRAQHAVHDRSSAPAVNPQWVATRIHWNLRRRARVHSFSISRAERAAAIALWPATSHGPASAWLLLDALLFSALLRQPGLFAQVSDFAGFACARSVDDLMQHATVLQTHHSTVISAEIQRVDIDSTSAYGEADAIRCDIDTPVITGSGQEGCVVQATLSAYAGTQFLLRTTVALMISPLSSSAKQLEQRENV